MNTNFLLALRIIRKNRLNVLIEVISLSVAFACLLLIFLYVSQESSYNRFHKNADQLFRVNYTVELANGIKGKTVSLDPKLSELIKNKVPQVSNSTAFRSAMYPTMQFGHQNFEVNLCIAEPDFFSMFSFGIIHGDKNKLFKNPDEVVITASLANKLMAVDHCVQEDLIGKAVSFMNTGDHLFTITGIMNDVPGNSSIQFEVLIPYKYENAFKESNNMFGNSSLFYEVDDPKNIQLANDQVVRVINDYYKDLVKDLQGQNILAGTNAFTPFVLPVDHVYFCGTQIFTY